MDIYKCPFLKIPKDFLKTPAKKVTPKHNAVNPDIFMQNATAYFFRRNLLILRKSI
jgi:hypothetical protein